MGPRDEQRDSPKTVSHARSIINKIESMDRRELAARAGGIGVEAKSYATATAPISLVSLKEKLRRAYIAGATRLTSPDELQAQARILVEEFYGPGEPDERQLESALRALKRIEELRGGKS